jgi:hypothetical protein
MIKSSDIVPKGRIRMNKSLMHTAVEDALCMSGAVAYENCPQIDHAFIL